MRRGLAFLLGALFVGSITMTHDAGAPMLSAEAPLVVFGALAAGSSGGLNGSAATVSVATTLLATTTNALWINNTDTSTWYARLNATSYSGLTSITSLTIGIDNGTKTAQVTGALGSLSQTGGAYVALPAGSSNKLYVTQVASLLGTTSSVQLDLYASDATDDVAYVVTHATLTLT